MRTRIIVAAALGLALGAGPAQAGLADTARPGYDLAEGISDRVYSFLRSHFIGRLLPGRLTRSLQEAPRGDSYALFQGHLQRKQTRCLQRLHEAYPANADLGRPDPGRMQHWRSWAAEEQASVVIDSYQDTLFERYQLPRFGRASERYLKDRRHWDPGLLSMAGLLGGSFAYLNGVHAQTRAGRFELSLDMRSGLRIREALAGQGDLRRAAGLELGLSGRPLRLFADSGIARGRLRPESYGLKYRLRY